jgi:hypothetical protein
VKVAVGTTRHSIVVTAIMRAERGTHSQGTDYKRKESTKNRVHRTRYPPLKATCWGHTHSGGEVAHKLTLRRRGMRIKTAHKKGGSERIGYVFEVFLLKRYLRSSAGSQE